MFYECIWAEIKRTPAAPEFIIIVASVPCTFFLLFELIAGGESRDELAFVFIMAAGSAFSLLSQLKKKMGSRLLGLVEILWSSQQHA